MKNYMMKKCKESEMHANRTKIDEDRSSVDQIRRWTCGVKEMIKKVEKVSENDIRTCFS